MAPEQRHARWPEHLPVGALRVVRWSARYDETVIFYRDYTSQVSLAGALAPDALAAYARQATGSKYLIVPSL